jgi:hypothetical protein
MMRVQGLHNHPISPLLFPDSWPVLCILTHTCVVQDPTAVAVAPGEYELPAADDPVDASTAPPGTHDDGYNPPGHLQTGMDDEGDFQDNQLGSVQPPITMDNSGNGSKKGLSVGAAAGVGLVALLAIAGCALAALFIHRRHRGFRSSNMIYGANSSGLGMLFD